MYELKSLQELLDDGAAFLQAGDLAAAQKIADDLLSQTEVHPQSRYFASDIESMRGNARAALQHLQAIQPKRVSPRVRLRKAELYTHTGQRLLAIEEARFLVENAGDDTQLLISAASLLIQLEHFGDLEEPLSRARQAAPEHEQLMYLQAVVYSRRHRTEAALAVLEELLGRNPQHLGAMYLRSQIARAEDPAHIDALLGALQTIGPSEQGRAMLNYALGKDYERKSDHAAAFASVEEGAAAYRSLLNYDGQQELRAQSEIREVFTRERAESLTPGDHAQMPIFLVGLPRSGLAVTESVLSQHSQVDVLGDTSAFRQILGELASAAAPSEASDAQACLAVDFPTLGKNYLQRQQENGAGSGRFVDRTPFNYLYCGHILTALPNARIVLVKRDPLDNFYALYSTLFFGACPFSYDMDELRDYMLSYHQQMQHWQSLFPAQIYELSYEALIREPAAQAEALLGFCGLDWEESVLQPDRALHEERIGISEPQRAILAPIAEAFAKAGLR